MSVLSAIFDSTRRDLSRARVLVQEINAFGPQMQQLTDEQMREKTDEFRDRLARGQALDDVLAEAYALVREATWRVLGKRQIRFRVYQPDRSLPDDSILPLDQADEFEATLKRDGRRYDREALHGPFRRPAHGRDHAPLGPHRRDEDR